MYMCTAINNTAFIGEKKTNVRIHVENITWQISRGEYHVADTTTSPLPAEKQGRSASLDVVPLCSVLCVSHLQRAIYNLT